MTIKGYSLEAKCHECIMVIATVGPYVLIEELVDDMSDMMKRHREKVHGGEPKP